MKQAKAIALIATVLIIGKVTLTILPGHSNGKDFASVVWVLLLLGFYVLAAYSVRWARPIMLSDLRYITIFGVIISFLAGFIIHGGTVSDKITEISMSLIAVFFLMILITLLWLRLPEVPMYDWNDETGKSIPLIWKRSTGELIARGEDGESLLASASDLGEAFVKSIIFHFFPLPDSSLKTRIDKAFEIFPVPVIHRDYKLERAIIIGIAIVTGVVMLFIWNMIGAASILWSLFLYVFIVLRLQAYLLKTFHQGSQLGKNLETAPLAIKAYERSYRFFSTRLWLRFLTPFSLIFPDFQAQKDLSSIGSTYIMTMRQKDKFIEAYQRLVTLYPEHRIANWLLNVIREIEAES